MNSIERFAQDFAALQFERAGLIETLRLELEMSGEALDDFFYEQIDELKGYLGAQAANETSDNPNEQEAAISAAEDWVASHLAGEGYRAAIAITLYLNGVREGAQRLRAAVH